MARTARFKVNVDRQMKLTVDVSESGVATLKLSDEVDLELAPGEGLVVVLRPAGPVGIQRTAGKETFNNSGSTRLDDYQGSAGAAAERAAGADPNASEEWNVNENRDR